MAEAETDLESEQFFEMRRDHVQITLWVEFAHRAVARKRRAKQEVNV